MKAVMIYGAPGAGKGTQANLLAWRKGFIHFDTGAYLEQLLHDPKNQNDPMIKRERELFDSGKLNTPAFVLKLVSKKAKEIGKAGFGIVFSGSPRTVFEAFGDKKHKGLLSILEKVYGKENIFPIVLTVHPETSTKRNSNRKICSVCKNVILYNDSTHHHTNCPLCGGPLRKREGKLDDPETIKVRLKEYQERTFPIFEGLRSGGYKVTEIDGEPLPYQVHEQVLSVLQ